MDESSESPGIRMVVGLGNPGSDYAGTRHNVGFAAVDRFAGNAGATWESKPAWRAEVARCACGILLVKPMTYMNLSGQAVASVMRFFKWGAGSLLVVLDDVALPLGQLRIRGGGSHGGHNGMRSIIDHFATQGIPRLRIGIGDERAGQDLSGHVLGRFAVAEREKAELAVARAADAIECIVKKGIETAMNIYNKDQTNYE